MAFITFEGIDGCGKSTLVENVSKMLITKSHIVTSDPGGTLFGTKCKKFILQNNLLASTELKIFSLARTVLVESIIEPCLKSKTIILCDRYYDSTFAYQSGEYDVTDDVVYDYTKDLPEPNLTFLLDCDVETCLNRIGNKCPDRIESKGLDYFKRVRARYLNRASKYKHRFILLDAENSIQYNTRLVFENVIFKSLIANIEQ